MPDEASINLEPTVSFHKPSSIGCSSIEFIHANNILTKATGFMNDYDYTLNPYTGCTFGCTYCYAAFFVREQEAQANWGHWLRVKENALVLLKRKRKKPLNDKSIYMSSVTDPYQPIERKLELTRQILEELLAYHHPRLVIQTRGPLVVRDIDLLKQFSTLQVNMTVTTDDETVRRIFEPFCPSLSTRLEAIKTVHEAGIPTCLTLTPLLPITDPHHFARQLAETGVSKFVVQPFHRNKGRFAAGTRNAAMQLFQERQWNDAAYRQVVDILKSYLPGMTEGKQGFAPI